MKINRAYLTSHLAFCMLFLLFSCEKSEKDLDNTQLILKSQEVNAYVYQEFEGNINYTVVVPVKIYVKGGSPAHETGDYHFRIAEGSLLPKGLMLDSITGVISGDNKQIEPKDKIESFEIKVDDGHNRVSNTYKLITRYIISGNKVAIPAMQFSSPETSLICDLKSNDYGVSLSMSGGKPPYTFSLAPNESLPGGLSLNSGNGVISGTLKNVKKGFYDFSVQCTDSEGNQAISMCTSQMFEKYQLIIR